jgi:cytochrome c peroxidase
MLRLILRCPAWLLMAGMMLGPVAAPASPAASPLIGSDAAIIPVPPPPAVDPLKLMLGERLFNDRRLSHDDKLACSSCHDVHTNGADDNHRMTARDGSPMPFSVLSVFNAALKCL